MLNLAIAIKFEAAYQRWVACDPIVGRLAATSDADLRRVFAMVAQTL